MSAVEATDACLARIDADNGRLNAFILVMADEARRQAREADRELAGGRDRGPLHGVPMSIKDLIDVRGTPTTAASRVRAGHVAVARRADRRAPAPRGRDLRRQDQPPRVRARRRRTRTRHSVRRAIRTIRRGRPADRAAGPPPASSPAWRSRRSARIRADRSAFPRRRAATVGLKPTFGEIVDGRRRAAVAIARSRRVRSRASVADAHLLYHVLRGDAAPRPLAAAPARGCGSRSRGRTSPTCWTMRCARRSRTRSNALRAAGARVQDVEIRHARDIAAVYLHTGLAEAAAYHAATLETTPELYTPSVRLRLEMGRHILAEDYVRAEAGRQVLRREVDAALAEHDALVLPTLPIPAPRDRRELGDDRRVEGTGTQPAAASHPALQSHRASGALAAERTHLDRASVLASNRRRRTHTDALLGVALACEALMS